MANGESQVIHRTFEPLAAPGQSLPSDLAPKLLHRFSSDEGYAFDPDLPSLLRNLRDTPGGNAVFDALVIGVVTNSDDRVPDILSSFGLNVSPLRYGVPPNQATMRKAVSGDYDIDFHCMSYDVGFEKPDRRIFDAAEDMLKQVITARGDSMSAGPDLSLWDKVYVGDEYEKDIRGALNAGWHPVFFDEEGGRCDVANLADLASKPLVDLFSRHEIVRVNSVRTLVEFLTGNRSRG